MFKNLPFWSLTPKGYQLTLFIFFSFISYSWFFIYVQRFRNGITRIGRFIKIIIIIIIVVPSEEETVEEQQVQGLSRKQHYTQYVQAATELEDIPLGEDTAKEQTAKAIEYMHGAAHLREAAWQMTGVGLHRLHLALAGSPTYEVFKVLQEHFLSEVQ